METTTPLKLIQTSRYPGFSFRFSYQVQDLTPHQMLKYSILRVTSWLRAKLDETGYAVSYLPQGRPEDFDSVTDESFRSFHVDEGVVITVTSILDEGIWALRIKEPDSDADNNQPVPGRFFVTDVALRLTEDEYVDMGCRVSILDPKGQAVEVAYAYRPAIIRETFDDEKVQIRRSLFLGNEPLDIRSDSSLADFRRLLEDENNELPCVVFTSGSCSPDTHEYIKDLFLSSPFATSVPTNHADLLIKEQKIQEKIEDEKTMVLDAFAFAQSVRAYARVFCLEKGMETKFRNQCGSFENGNAIFFDARKFGKGKREYPIRAGSQFEIDASLRSIKKYVYAYPKHKEWDFSGLLFQDEAEKREHRRILETIRSSREPDSEKLETLVEENLALVNRIEDLLFDNYDLQTKLSIASTQAEEKWKVEKEILQQQIGELETERNEAIQNVRWLRDMRRSMAMADEEIPLDWPYDKAALWIETYFPDRLAMTGRAERELKKSRYRDAIFVYECLKLLANEGYRYFVSDESYPYEEFLGACRSLRAGTEESGITRVYADIVPEQYYVVYNGSRCLLERHLKYGTDHNPETCLRIYFFADKENKRLVIGSLTEHLDTRAT